MKNGQCVWQAATVLDLLWLFASRLHRSREKEGLCGHIYTWLQADIASFPFLCANSFSMSPNITKMIFSTDKEWLEKCRPETLPVPPFDRYVYMLESHVVKKKAQAWWAWLWWLWAWPIDNWATWWKWITYSGNCPSIHEYSHTEACIWGEWVSGDSSTVMKCN